MARASVVPSVYSSSTSPAPRLTRPLRYVISWNAPTTPDCTSNASIAPVDALTKNAGGCPALQYVSLPPRRSTMPTNSVANVSSREKPRRNSLRSLTMCAGASPCQLYAPSAVLTAALTEAASTPLPDTSPMITQARSFGRRMRS